MKSLSVFALILSLGTLAVGCTGEKTPPPEESVVLQNSGQTVWTFIHEARTQRDKAKTEAQLSILMESLDAQAESFGGELVELRDAAKEYQAALQSGADPKESLQQFEGKVKALVPEPEVVGE